MANTRICGRSLLRLSIAVDAADTANVANAAPVDRAPHLTSTSGPIPSSAGEGGPTQRQALRLRPEFIERGRATRILLASESPGAGADEQLLFGLISAQLPVLSALEDAQC